MNDGIQRPVDCSGIRDVHFRIWKDTLICYDSAGALPRPTAHHQKKERASESLSNLGQNDSELGEFFEKLLKIMGELGPVDLKFFKCSLYDLFKRQELCDFFDKETCRPIQGIIGILVEIEDEEFVIQGLKFNVRVECWHWGVPLQKKRRRIADSRGTNKIGSVVREWIFFQKDGKFK